MSKWRGGRWAQIQARSEDHRAVFGHEANRAFGGYEQDNRGTHLSEVKLAVSPRLKNCQLRLPLQSRSITAIRTRCVAIWCGAALRACGREHRRVRTARYASA